MHVLLWLLMAVKAYLDSKKTSIMENITKPSTFLHHILKAAVAQSA
jgi:hypothetical protein